jgi:tRNA (guanine-N7-)-methyltransferase
MPTKLEKFSDVSRFPNCFAFGHREISQGFALSGKWHSHFHNSNPIVLELGCGRGEYTVGLAARHPEKNFIGVDIKGNRIWSGASSAIEGGLKNVAFLRTRIDFIQYCFTSDEVDEIWITFPDPQPQKPRARKRLTHPLFLERYRQFLKAGGIVHLKTDSTLLYEFTLETIGSLGLPLHWHTDDLYQNCPSDRKELVEISTYYEKLFTGKGEKIKYVCFGLDAK